MKTRSLDTACLAWGEGLPEWISALARECDRSSQRKAAELLAVSTPKRRILTTSPLSRQRTRRLSPSCTETTSACHARAGDARSKSESRPRRQRMSSYKSIYTNTK